jgi:hypothetical protein
MLGDRRARWLARPSAPPWPTHTNKANPAANANFGFWALKGHLHEVAFPASQAAGRQVITIPLPGSVSVTAAGTRTDGLLATP